MMHLHNLRHIATFLAPGEIQWVNGHQGGRESDANMAKAAMTPCT